MVQKSFTQNSITGWPASKFHFSPWLVWHTPLTSLKKAPKEQAKNAHFIAMLSKIKLAIFHQNNIATNYKALITSFRLLWDADSWNFSNVKTINAYRTFWLLLVLAALFKTYIVKNQRFYSVNNSQLVSNDFQLLKALSLLRLMCK